MLSSILKSQLRRDPQTQLAAQLVPQEAGRVAQCLQRHLRVTQARKWREEDACMGQVAAKPRPP